MKKRSKKRSYDPTASEISTTTGSITYKHNDPNQNDIIPNDTNNANNNIEPYYFTATIKNDERPLNKATTAYEIVDYSGGSLQNATVSAIQQQQSANDSDSYGTFRKGPYIIGNEDIGQHVCHRKYEEMATEL